MTELEIREMIDKARAGDPEANYRMSEWALEQAAAEPEEERWNRLAAKCLLKAADAGYAPAQKRMDDLIRQLDEDAPAPETLEAPGPAREYSEPVPEDAPNEGAPSVLGTAKAALSRVVSTVTSLFKNPDADEEPAAQEPKAAQPAARESHSTPPAEAGRHAGGASVGIVDRVAAFFRFSEWSPEQFKKRQRIVLIACAVLVVLIIILILSGRGKKAEEPEEAQIPVAATAEPVQPSPTPYVELYPDEATRSAIESANLEIFPAESDYVTEATTAVVSTQGSDLNLRRGTAANYGQITTIPNGTTVDVYAVKSGWSLVYYSGVYGWCSGDYLK